MSGNEPTCKKQRIFVSKDGDYNLRGASYFCGSRLRSPVQIKSIGNEMTIGVASKERSGSVQVVLKFEKINQLNCDCSWNVRNKIISGSNAMQNEFIGHAAFVTKSNGLIESICGGTIISQNFILTCAHCIIAIKNVHKWNAFIVVGRHNITAQVNQDTMFADSYQIGKTIVHKGYKIDTNVNDIALVKTTRYIKFNRGVGAACLPFAYENFIVPSGTILTAIGFGSTQFALSASADRRSWILQKVQLTVNNTLGKCRNDMKRLCAVGSLNKSQFRGDSCQRDSGGGLYGYISNRYFLFAITSEGYACGAKDSYSINVYIGKYLLWIKSNINGEFLCRK